MATVLDKGKQNPAEKYDAFVEGQLARARQRIRTLDAVVALLGWLVGTLAYVLIMVALDRLFDLPLLARQIGLGLYGVASAAYLTFALVIPFSRRLNPYYAARQIEQTVPQSKNSLVNWLDLRDQKLPGAIRGAVANRAAKDLAQADLERAISGRRAAWLGGVSGGLAVGLLVALFLVGFGPFFGFLGRTFLPFAAGSFPTRTQITLLRPENGDLTVSIGQPVSFAVRVDGRTPDVGAPDAVRLLFRYQQNEPYEERPFQHDSGREWVASVPGFQVQNGFYYRVAGGDYQTPEYHVAVRSTPLVQKFEAAYKYRPYTGFQDDSNEDPNLKGVRGTQVTLTAHTNRIVLTEDKKVKGELTLELQSGTKHLAAEPVLDDPSALRFRLVLEESGTYKLWFSSAEGERNVEPMSYAIQATPDTAPTVTLTRPGRDVSLPANGTLSLEGHANDDLGVVSVVLRMKVENGPELHPKPYREGKSFKLDSGGYPPELKYKDFVPLAELKDLDGKPVEAKPGMVIEYWVEATDACDFPAPHVGSSAHFKVIVGEPTDPMAAQQDAQQAQAEQKEHEAQQDKDIQQQNQNAGQNKPQDKDGQGRKDPQQKPDKNNGQGNPNNPEAKKPDDKNNPGQGDKPQDGMGEGTKNAGNEGDPNKDTSKDDEKNRKDLERIKNEKDRQDENKGDAKSDPNKEKGEAKDRKPQQGQQDGNKQNGNQKDGDKGEKGSSKGGGDDKKNQGEKTPQGQGKDGGQQQGPQNKPDAGAAKGGGEQTQPQKENPGEAKGGGEQNQQQPQQPGQAKAGDGQQQPQAGGPGQPGQAGQDQDPKEGQEGEGKGAGAQDLKDQKFGGSKGKNGSDDKLRREPGESKGGGDAGDQNKNLPTGDPKDDPKTLSRSKDKGDGQQNQNPQQQSSAKGEGQKNQGGGQQGKGEAKFDKGDGSSEKGTAKDDQKKDGDGSGAGKDEKATKDDVEKLKKKARSQDAKEREDANKKLDDIGNKAEDKDVRDAARQAKQDAQEERRQQEEAKPGEAKAGGQPQDPMKTGQQGEKQEQVGQGKGGDGKEEKQAGGSKGDQPGAPGKDKGVSKGQGEKSGGNTAANTAGNQTGNDNKPPENGQPGGGSGGEGVKAGPPGVSKPAKEFDADKDAHKNAGDLQLENIKKVIEELKKNPQALDKALQDLKMSPERFKQLEDYVNEKLPPPGTASNLQQTGVKRADAGEGPGTGVQGGGQGKVPPGYEDAFKKFTQSVADPNKR